MVRPVYWTCWTPSELNCRPKMLTRKAIRTAPSLPFYCTNRSLADGRKLFLRPSEVENHEADALLNDESDRLMRALVCDYVCWPGFSWQCPGSPCRSMSVVQFPASRVLINSTARWKSDPQLLPPPRTSSKSSTVQPQRTMEMQPGTIYVLSSGHSAFSAAVSRYLNCVAQMIYKRLDSTIFVLVTGRVGGLESTVDLYEYGASGMCMARRLV